ncbi:hypothetical protein KIL84_006853, partial [Mauremys mutica]
MLQVLLTLRTPQVRVTLPLPCAHPDKRGMQGAGVRGLWDGITPQHGGRSALVGCSSSPVPRVKTVTPVCSLPHLPQPLANTIPWGWSAQTHVTVHGHCPP